MRNSILLILCMVFTTILFGQNEKSALIMEKRDGPVILKLSSYQSHLKVGDTLHINFNIENPSGSKSILFFSPNKFPLEPDSICWYVISEGGNWMVTLGSEQPLYMVKLSPKDKYEYEYRIIIAAMSREEKQKCRIPIATEDYISNSSRYIVVFFGYYVDDGLFKGFDIKELPSKSISDKKRIELTEKLKRVVLGPIQFLVE
jgi:hypothetical protein